MAASSPPDSQQKSESPTRTLSVLVENRFGVLSRIAGLFSARGYNIESLTVAGSSDPTLSRITMVVRCEPHQVQQMIKQINKLLDVVTAEDLTDSDCVERELVLVRVRVSGKERDSLLAETEIFQAKVVTSPPDSSVLEVTGDSQKIDAFLEVVRAYGVDEMVRTGRVALPRGSRTKVEPLTLSATSCLGDH